MIAHQSQLVIPANKKKGKILKIKKERDKLQAEKEKDIYKKER